ncbi:MAG: methylmalonyl Co-A mutase-associated GTPase MeaB, partial [Alphaproteobacteria bacterium]
METPKSSPDLLADLLADLVGGSRRALARAITLVESGKPEHREQAEALLSAALPHTGKAVRVGISGVPGVGKSTFIENMGSLLCDKGHKLAVLAVDPTSKRTGGSIMGDKTRMPLLSQHANAYVRPSPAGMTLGGVARRTRECLLLCEAAGYDLIFVETVGVGQSETAVADMVDVFTLLMLPAGGDELQGVKRGIIELADFILVNKADGDLRRQALATLSDYKSAARFMRPRFEALPCQAMACSAETHEGLEAFWHALM